jgi:3-phosphoshikimate 1-carboxyvinyltransferase
MSRHVVGVRGGGVGVPAPAGDLRVRGTGPVTGRLRVPGDKSITHRGLLLGAIADGHTVLEGYLNGGDCQATIAAVEALGVVVEREGPDALVVRGGGLDGLRPPTLPIDCRNSGTTMRLLAGLLAGQSFDSVLDGSLQLRHRPMSRVTEPLRAMGATIDTVDGRAPLRVVGSRLTGTRHRLAVPSAQVKSALLLAGLHADGETVVEEPVPSRDHTERLLRAMGAPISRGSRHGGRAGSDAGASGDAGEWRIRRPEQPLRALRLQVPGDPSSAAFPWALAAASGGRVRVDGVGVNPGRAGFLRALERMGARVELLERREMAGEPVADVVVEGGDLVGATFSGAEIVAMIDELPVLAVVATRAAGETVVRDAGELRVKETDRIDAVVTELSRFGARIEARPDGFVVHGPCDLRGGHVDGRGDHRLVMALAVAGALAVGETVIAGGDCFADSYPGFDHAMRGLGVEVRTGGR